MTRLPLVGCDRLHAQLSAVACVARYRARVVYRSTPARPSRVVNPAHPECAGCPQGEARSQEARKAQRSDATDSTQCVRKVAPYRKEKP